MNVKAISEQMSLDEAIEMLKEIVSHCLDNNTLVSVLKETLEPEDLIQVYLKLQDNLPVPK